MTPGVVVHRRRIRHAGDSREAARHRRQRAGGDRLLVLLPGLAQVHVHVDEPWRDHQVRRNRHDLGARLRRKVGPDAGDPVAVDQDVEHAVTSIGRVDDPSALKQPLHVPLRRPEDRAPPSGRPRRWRPARESPSTGPSATSEAISTPRFIGPGCMMITSGFARPHARLGHPEQVEVLAQRREEGALHPLLLDAQHHHHVGIAHGLVHRVDATVTPSCSMPRGTSVGGPLTHTWAPSLVSSSTIRAQHAAVQQVADDGHFQARNRRACAARS